MQMKILRGIPGSGKSTYQRTHFPDAVVVSSDHYFEKEGVYRFDPSLLDESHGDCFRRAVAVVQEKVPLIVVDNTTTRAMEVAPYATLGQAYGYDVEVITLLVDARVAVTRNIHRVPENTILNMDRRLRVELSLPPRWKQRIIRRG